MVATSMRRAAFRHERLDKCRKQTWSCSASRQRSFHRSPTTWFGAQMLTITSSKEIRLTYTFNMENCGALGALHPCCLFAQTGATATTPAATRGHFCWGLRTICILKAESHYRSPICERSGSAASGFDLRRDHAEAIRGDGRLFSSEAAFWPRFPTLHARFAATDAHRQSMAEPARRWNAKEIKDKLES